jgi:hypothetical protein
MAKSAFCTMYRGASEEDFVFVLVRKDHHLLGVLG